MPNSRELATLIWLGIVVLGALLDEKTYSSLGNVLRSFLNPVIFLPLLLMFAYIGLEVWLGARAYFWSTDLVKDTVICGATLPRGCHPP